MVISKHLLLVIFSLILSSCFHLTKPLLPEEILKKAEAPFSFYMEGKIKIKRSHYGFSGRIQVIQTKEAFRLDIFTPFYHPLLTVIKKEDFKFILYEQRLSSHGDEFLKSIEKLLPVGLKLEAFIAILSKQLWLMPFSHFRLKENKDKYYLLLIDKSGKQQELWINKKNLKTERFILKNYMNQILCEVSFSYNAEGEIKYIKIFDMLATHLKITYEVYKTNIPSKVEYFNVPELSN